TSGHLRRKHIDRDDGASDACTAVRSLRVRGRSFAVLDIVWQTGRLCQARHRTPVERDPLGWGALTSSKRGAHLAARSCGRNQAANPAALIRRVVSPVKCATTSPTSGGRTQARPFTSRKVRTATHVVRLFPSTQA